MWRFDNGHDEMVGAASCFSLSLDPSALLPQAAGKAH